MFRALLLALLISMGGAAPAIAQINANQTQVQVTLLPEDAAGVIDIPSLPKSAKTARTSVNRDYNSLYNISGDMCADALNAPTGQITGFAKELIRYEKVRKHLNTTLKRYHQGFAPGIIDWTGISALRYPPTGSKVYGPKVITTTQACSYVEIAPPPVIPPN